MQYFTAFTEVSSKNKPPPSPQLTTVNTAKGVRLIIEYIPYLKCISPSLSVVILYSVPTYMYKTSSYSTSSGIAMLLCRVDSGRR